MEIMDIVLYSLIGGLLIILALCLAIANFAGENLLTVYQKYSKFIGSNDTTMGFAYMVSDCEFDGRISCKVIKGTLTDNYYKGTISLSENVARANNISAFAVCAHEMGHALQYRDTPKKMKSFHRKKVFCIIASKFTFPFFVAGVVCAFFHLMAALVLLGIAVFSFVCGLLAKLSTIKIEKEASENALVLLKKYADFDDESIKQAKKVLNAAKLTYIAEFLKSVLAWTLMVRKYDFY